MPLADFVTGDNKRPVLILLIAVGLILLIASSNIAGLVLARTSGRAREIAIRAAMGAGRWQILMPAGTRLVAGCRNEDPASCRSP